MPFKMSKIKRGLSEGEIFEKIYKITGEKFSIQITKTDEGWTAYCPAFNHASTNGITPVEAIMRLSVVVANEFKNKKSSFEQ